MTAKFVKDASAFWDTLGLSQGHIVFEEKYGIDPIWVTDLEQGNFILSAAVQAGMNSNEAKQIKTNMITAGIATNMSAIFEAVKNFQMPEDFKPEFKFMAYDTNNFPIKHGNIIRINHGPVATILTLSDGICSCHGAYQMELVNVSNVIHVLKGMLKAGLPMDNEEQKKQYRALSGNGRRRYANTILKAWAFNTACVITVHIMDNK